MKPLRYTISNTCTRLRSDVRVSSPAGTVWFCADGAVELRSDATSVDVVFDTFWYRSGNVDAPAEPNPFTSGAPVSPLDAAVNALGKLFFFRGLAVFPVLFLSEDAQLCVFRFPPLSSNICARRL